MTPQELTRHTKALIDDLKAVCANYGLGNDGNEFKIITQVFLYKFLTDKFAYEVKQLRPELQEVKSWEEALSAYSEDDYELLLMELGERSAELHPVHFLSYLFNRQQDNDFAQLFDDTLMDIAAKNNQIFAVKTFGGAKITLFDRVSQYIADPSRQDDFCRALINKLAKDDSLKEAIEFSYDFEGAFHQSYDFFATIFEYLIKDYNKDGGGKYAEYYTPHAVAKIMARILVTEEGQSLACYDPAAGTGSLLMSLAHAIGEERCTLYTQDISQKSSSLLRLNFILNNLVPSISNVVQGNTLLEPAHRDEEGQLRRYDYIVCNPPFKLDFSDFRDDLDRKENAERFFAGLPKIPKKAKDKMAIYPLFIQHIMHVLGEQGKAAIVVPTGFITAQSGIDKNIRKALVERRMLSGVVSMPSNIFATTGTNVSILFLDRGNTEGKVVLLDASGLGKKVKEGKNQKTVLSPEEEQRIIDTYNRQEAVDDFSVVISYEEIAEKNYSFSAGQYFEVKIEYVDISPEAFEQELAERQQTLAGLFAEGRRLEGEIEKQLEGLKYA